MPATPTRTLNPLPFTDLEPKRFEDLVRQLAYDFRVWRRLEATGRAGSDDGFDARGLEIVQDAAPAPEPADDEAGEDAEDAGTQSDRLWLIQCKREKSIPPAKLKAHLADIKLSAEEKLHGIVFAAACDFSKLARDVFFAWCRDQGISEAHLWGKGELEDQLIQPKNDNLLFAYFGISLAIRRRSQATQIRAEIATKRKLKKIVESAWAPALFRDPTATEYPDAPEGEAPDKWCVRLPEKVTHRGLEVSAYWFHAYLDANSGEWDAADLAPSRRGYEDPWRVKNDDEEQLESAAGDAWHALPEANKAWLKVTGVIPYRNIVAVDDLGDDIVQGMHVYVPFAPRKGPFDYFIATLETIAAGFGRAWGDMDPKKRIVKFPPETRKPPKQETESPEG